MDIISMISELSRVMLIFRNLRRKLHKDIISSKVGDGVMQMIWPSHAAETSGSFTQIVW